MTGAFDSSTISWAFALLALVAAAAATLMMDMRRSTLALWVTGLAVGGLYMTVGAELLAIVQWILSTAVAISFVFFSAMFGEYGRRARPFDRDKILAAATGLILAALLVVVVAVALRGPILDDSAARLLAPADHSDLAAVGMELARNHFASLEILALTLFICVVGVGVIARPRRTKEEGS